MSRILSRTMPNGLRVALGVALVLVLIMMRANVAEASPACSDNTPDNRDCTFTEQLGYCLTSAITSYNQCSGGAGFLAKVGCGLAYEVDFYACYGSVPFKYALK